MVVAHSCRSEPGKWRFLRFTLIQYGLGAFGTMLSWAAMTYIGRRTLYLSGMGISFILLLSIGCISVTASASKGSSWGSIVLAFILVYNCTSCR
ncbi:hypothetical protein V1523DRAFT_422043 [Lipomyces doorenjongii]